MQFAVLGAVLIAFEFFVDGTVGVPQGRSEDGSGAGRPLTVESTLPWAASSSDEEYDWPPSDDFGARG